MCLKTKDAGKRPRRALGTLELMLFGALATVGLTCDGQYKSTTTEQEDSAGGTDSCASGERFFNGECRAACTGSSDCPTDTQCMNLDDDSSLCLPYTNCAYLGSDTQCVGDAYYVQSRWGMSQAYYTSYPEAADPEDVTGYADAFFVIDDNRYLGAYDSLSADGCLGNARWTTVSAEGNVSCGNDHSVERCMLRDRHCILVFGTTIDRVSP